jgi:hypothetical protein
MSNVSTFIKEYVRAIIEGYAAVFAGAGLSRASGYVNWKDLVRPLAEEIGLDVNKEHDLVAVAQYYRNERGSRFSINQKILNEFTKDTMQNKNIEILARLPIKTYWTTNYDELLESALERNNKKADVKTTQESLANNICDRDAVVYKMHGDVRDPAKTVVTKDDYEIYGNERPLFRTALQGDLISKTFLFIGFSFEDPNLDHILSQIRILLGESSRDHYCFFERVKKRENDENQQEFSYNVAKQELRIKDLRRYGIQAVLLDTYSEITCILREIESSVLRKNIFISGALAEYEPPWNKESVDNFTFSLAQDLVKHDYRIISGFGKGIGSTIINGALEEIMRSKYKHVDEYLCLRPFPQIVSGGLPRGELWKRYREDMISQAGIAVFLFGNKEVDGNVVFSDGMLEEFEIARKLGKIIIPVGSTGGAAAKIFNVVKEGLKDYPYLVDYCDQLQTEVDSGKLVELVRKIIHKQQVV